jgi:hypothetical protein
MHLLQENDSKVTSNIDLSKMIKFFIVVIFILISSFSFAQSRPYQSTKEAEGRIPATLSEAHVELEYILSPEELEKIDAMNLEEDMIKYHFGLGMTIRNRWGLWSSSLLAKHMQKNGFSHPDDMSNVILNTFWCKRHGKKFGLAKRAAEYAAYWEAARNEHEKEVKRSERAKEKIRSMMMSLILDKSDVPIVRLPDRTGNNILPQFLFFFRGGVFIAARNRTNTKKLKYSIEVYFLDLNERKIHKIYLPEFTETHSVVVAGKTAWFSGSNKGKTILLGIKNEKHTKIQLPLDGSPPQLGFSQQNLLAIYPKDVFKRIGDKWERIYSGNNILPSSGTPPELHGNLLLLCDQGQGGMEYRRLRWLHIGDEQNLTSLVQDINVVEKYGPRWENTRSYAMTKTGDLWTCVGGKAASSPTSLLKRSKNGIYSVAIMNNSVEFSSNLLRSPPKTDQGLSVSGITLLPNDTILLVGNSGLYKLNGSKLTKKLAFENYNQKIPIKSGMKTVHLRWNWIPNKLLLINKNSYVISGETGGIHLLSRDKKNKWNFELLDKDMGHSIVW